jgi:molybdate transport system substrate-binding protein
MKGMASLVKARKLWGPALWAAMAWAWGLALGGDARAAEVSVAVAANFAAPMQRLAAAFEQDTGHKAQLAVGSTGRFYAQVKNGAPFEVLLAADDETPARLEREGLAVAGTRFTYAIGRLALWSRDPGLVDAQGEVLKRGAYTRLAVADPKVAPYGAAAVEVLQRLGLMDAVAPKFVQGESLAQAFQFVATGNAPLGFVAWSQVLAADGRLARGSVWQVPASLHAPIRQDAVLLVRGQGNPAATALLAYLRSDKVRALITAAGYDR